MELADGDGVADLSKAAGNRPKRADPVGYDVIILGRCRRFIRVLPQYAAANYGSPITPTTTPKMSR